MKISPETLLSLSPDEAALTLLHAGWTLRGKNLKRGSWLEIAQGLHVTRITAVLLSRLAAAETREDALRVLRITRKWARRRTEGSQRCRKAVRKLTRPDAEQLVIDHSPAAWEEYLAEMQWDDDWELEAWGNHPAEFQAWQAEQAPLRLAEMKYPGIEPVTPVQAFLAAYAFDRRWDLEDHPESIASRLPVELYRELRNLATPSAFQLSLQERDFLERYRLEHMLRFADDPDAGHPAELCTGYELAGLALLEEKGGWSHPFTMDWVALSAWMIAAFKHPPGRDHVATGMAFYRFCEAAPVERVLAVLQQVEAFHPAWLPALFYALPRAADLTPVLRPVADREHAVHPLVRRWEQFLASGFGSTLVLHNLRHNLLDVLVHPVPVTNSFQPGLNALLLAGGGTLRRMDYPRFTLTCRPSATLVRLEALRDMARVAWDVLSMHWSLASYWEGRIGELLAESAARCQRVTLPPELLQSISVSLERHAVAYVLLMERVFREEMVAAPFRLRRKHIRRFWEALEAGELEGLPPGSNEVSVQAVLANYGAERMKEGLIHALLDGMHAVWTQPEGAAFSLKEACIDLMRQISFTYQCPEVDLPMPVEIEEGNDRLEDPAFPQQYANFLIHQFEHTGPALARVLMIDPEAGLPRLNGGQVTEMERSYRRAIRAASGVSVVDMMAEVVKTYTCRPLSKPEALHRGDLAGDCSTQTVPLRALSPHHTYYGIFEGAEQQRGYMTVYEAWAVMEAGRKVPVLCLETVNAPIRYFESVQQDLLLIFEAVARSRGLLPGLVLITDIGTWNFQNGVTLRGSRRFRQGTPVELLPADPVGWQVYTRLSGESAYYTAFESDHTSIALGRFRLLAKFDPDLDAVQPENRAEAERLGCLPPCRPRVIARTGDGVAGFISGPPEIL